ncbi:MAG: response regulator transcription factor [Elusimicrobia bacterium]|nr:response regulator transcription factor [Elusimicrobiota bacterium]
MAKHKILAIDDEISVCDLYEKGLTALGYEVTCAPSARRAREFLAKTKPDLILMDIMMPDQDGISLTRELREQADTSSIPIMVVSGLSDAATLNDALLFGAVDYLVKPFEIEVLKSKIERALSMAEKRRKS